MISQQRYDYLDFLRALAIVGVLVIHTFYPFHLQETPFVYWTMLIIHTCFIWAVPVYAMISGALMLSRPIDNWRHFYTKKVIRIGIPLLNWTILYAIFDYFTQPDFVLSQRLIQSFIFGQPLYFLFAIAGLYTITPLLQKLIVSLKQQQLVIFTFSTLVITSLVSGAENWFLADTNILPHFVFNYFLYYLGYYLAGYMIHHLSIRISIKQLLTTAGIATLLIIVTTHNLVSFLGITYRGQILFMQFSPLVIMLSLALFGLCRQLENKLNSIRYKSLIKQLSTYSLGLYFVHMLVLGFMRLVLGEFSSIFLESATYFGVSLSGSIVIVWLGRKLRLQYLLGL